MTQNNVISMAEFNRWQKNRIQEHQAEIVALKERITSLAAALAEKQANDHEVNALLRSHREAVKKLLGRLDWALDVIEEKIPEDKEIMESVETLRMIYKLS
jgi:soluble cytochrome b562